MSKLLTTYARSTGLKIKQPYIRKLFFPIPFEKYITLQTGSNQNAKNYDYFQEFVLLAKPFLDANKINIVQLGGKDDPQLNGTYDLRGKTSLPQAAYIIDQAIAHVGNDSWMQHYSCYAKIPTVVLFGSTSADNHGSYWKHDKTIFLESHRCGNKPSFSQVESPKTINFIKPEDIYQSFLSVLGINESAPFQTSYIGPFYQNVILEVIPNMKIDKNLFPEAHLTVRMDYHFDVENLVKILQTGRKINLFTNQDIPDVNILSFYKNQIIAYSHEINENTGTGYVTTVQNILSNCRFFSKETDQERLSDLKFKFFDIAKIVSFSESTRQDAEKEISKYLNKDIDLNQHIDTLLFKTNKFIFSNGKVFTSFAHLKADTPIKNFNENILPVIDSQDFWKDVSNFLIIKKI